MSEPDGILTRLTEDEVNAWAQEYDRIAASKPEQGDLVTSHDGSKIKVFIDKKFANREPFIFIRLFVPKIVGLKPKWYGVSENDHFIDDCILGVLHHMDRNTVIKKFGMVCNIALVKSFRVVRLTKLKSEPVLSIEELE